MKEGSIITLDQFTDYLRLLFEEDSLIAYDEKRIRAALLYWADKHENGDDRQLAYGLAAIKLRKLETKDEEVGKLSGKKLRDYFAFQSERWPKVKRVRTLLDPPVAETEKRDGDIVDVAEDPVLALANKYYTAISTIRPLKLNQILIEEVNQLRKGDRVDLDSPLEKVFHELHERGLAALCFSGGGIRSATFGLGIVQSLAEHGLLSKFDYLSTVSGGGYLGSWLSAWVLREKINELIRRSKSMSSDDAQATGRDKIEEGGFDIVGSKGSRDLGIEIVQDALRSSKAKGSSPNPEPTQLQHLREYSNYMSPRVGLLSADSWTLLTIYVRNLFLNLTIFVPLIAAALMVPRFLLLPTMLTPSETAVWITLALSLLFGGWAIYFVVSRLPSKNLRPQRMNFSERNTHDDADEESDQEVTKKTASKDKVPAEAEDESLLDYEDKETDVGVLLGGVVPLVVSAFGAMLLWSWNIRTNNALHEHFNIFNFDLASHPNYLLVYALIGAFLAFAVGFATLLFVRGTSEMGLATLISAAVGGILSWLITIKLFDPGRVSAAMTTAFGPNAELFVWQIFFCLAIPLLLIITLVTAAVFVGLTSGKMTDGDREWLARYGGWVLIVGLVWIVGNALVLLGPSLLAAAFRVNWANLSFTEVLPPALVSLLGAASGVLSLGGGFSEKSTVRDEPARTRKSRFLATIPRAAAVVFLGFIFVVLASLTTFLIYGLGSLWWDGISPTFGSTWSHVAILKTAPVEFLFAAFILLAAIGTVMACFVNVNKFSLHGAYRDRLVRAYLGASNPERKSSSFTGFDESDNFQLHRLKDQRPLHVVNATLNLVGGKTLAWQNRKAASFTMTPLHCGSPVVGYRRTNEYCRNDKLGDCPDRDACNLSPACPVKPGTNAPQCQLPGKAIRLGTAMAISGAAANPNMGYYSSSVVTFLMSLFNIRLGWWLGNTNEKGARLTRGRTFFSKSSPSVAVLPLLNETLGRTDETKRYINVTDGGHFENLALYEMVLRRCRLIVLSDGAADADFKFGEIANAIQKCKVDLGVKISFKSAMNIYGRYNNEEGIVKEARFAVAEITYPERGKDGKPRKGVLLYTRPTYYGNREPRDVRYYAECNERFPHQSTGDQMYDEQQFEAYRGLGYFTMSEVIEEWKLDDKMNALETEARARSMSGTRKNVPEPGSATDS